MAPAFPPQIRDALARLRWAVRRSSPQQLVLLHYVLATLAGNALARVTVTMGGAVEMGQSEKLTQVGWADSSAASRVRDRWISPREGALRLNISLRTLRRRAHTPPYSSFCIRQDHGFKVSELGLADFMRRSRR